MKVGIPSEIFPNELRVAATPKTVKRLQKQGFEVYIQHNAGVKANFSDKDFEEAGAKIVATAADIYGKSDIVLKVKEPSFEEVYVDDKMVLVVDIPMSEMKPHYALGDDQKWWVYIRVKDKSVLASKVVVDVLKREHREDGWIVAPRPL